MDIVAYVRVNVNRNGQATRRKRNPSGPETNTALWLAVFFVLTQSDSVNLPAMLDFLGKLVK